MDFHRAAPPIFCQKTLPVLVAEWARASDHFRSFGQNLKWGPGKCFFFSKKKVLFEASFHFYAVFQALCNFSTAICSHFPKNGTSL